MKTRFLIWINRFYAFGAFLTVACFLVILAFHYPSVFRSGQVEALFESDGLSVFWLFLLFVSILLSVKGVLDGYFGKFGVVLLLLQAFSIYLYFTHSYNRTVEISNTRLACDWLILDYFFTALVFMPMEHFFPKYKEQEVLHEEWNLNLKYFIVYDLNVNIIFFIVQFPAHLLFNNNPVAQLHAFSESIPVWLGVLFALLIADAFQFIRHFIAHKLIAIWHFHSIHHSAEKMDWLSGSRNHLLDILVDRSFIFIPIYAMGFPTSVILIYAGIVSFQSVWVHTNSQLNLGFLKYIIVTPQYHHWHHAKHVHDKNFGIHFTYLDRLFGTYYLPEKTWPQETGITDDGFPPNSYLGQFIYPFRKNKQLLVGKLEGLKGNKS